MLDTPRETPSHILSKYAQEWAADSLAAQIFLGARPLLASLSDVMVVSGMVSLLG